MNIDYFAVLVHVVTVVVSPNFPTPVLQWNSKMHTISCQTKAVRTLWQAIISNFCQPTDPKMQENWSEKQKIKLKWPTITVIVSEM